jgi:hypothetical protein
MSRIGLPPLIFNWMLGFCLAPRLRVASAREYSAQSSFSPYFMLVIVGFLTVQLVYNHLQENALNLVVSLKFQIAWPGLFVKSA